MFNPLKYMVMDKNLNDVKMNHLNFYHNGRLVPVFGHENEGLDSFEFNGETFRCDDLVVVDGQIGNIELVSLEAGCCGLGMSFVYDDVMARRHWSMSSGYRCLMDGLRHATDEERRVFEIDAEDVYRIAEESDRKWKERFEVCW